MVLFNHSTRELTAKIVYYGPGLCGKTTNLRLLHEKLEQGTTGRLLSLSTAQDRTIYFDLLPVELGNVKGYTVRFQLCTVPGQVFYNETRKLVLKGVDGIVFVVDSQWSMLSHNLESFQNLRENMAELGQAFEETAVIIQYNKRDLPGVLSVQALQESLGFQEFPYVEAVAAGGKGVVETFKLVSKMTFVQLLKRLQRSPDGEKLGPEWVAPSAEDTSRTARIPAVGAELLALTSTVGPAPAPPTESPFETTASWPTMPRGEIFGDATVPPQLAPPPPPPESAAPADSDPADDTAREDPSIAETAGIEAAPAAVPEPVSFDDSPVDGEEGGLPPVPGPELSAPEPEPAASTVPDAEIEPGSPAAVPPTEPETRAEPAPAADATPALEPPPAPPPPPAPEPPPASIVWAEAFTALSSRLDDLARARSEETDRLETVAREGRAALEERLDRLPAPIERRLDEVLAALEQRLATLESALSGRVEELRTALEGRLGVLEDAVARLESSDRLDEVKRETADVKRLVESKLDEASGQSRRLGTFLRRALEELEPSGKE